MCDCKEHEEKHLCDYGCGNEAKYYFKTVDKFCCSKSHNSCPIILKKKIKNIIKEKPDVCDYGCGQEAKYYFKTPNKWCCEKSINKCPNKSKVKKSEKRDKPELCEYGCGREAKFYFKKEDKWCCYKYSKLCKTIPTKENIIKNKKICEETIPKEKCKCGCGNNVTRIGNEYIVGHNFKNRTYEEIYNGFESAEKEREKRRLAMTGKIREDMIGEKNIAKLPENRAKISKGVAISWSGEKGDERKRIQSESTSYGGETFKKIKFTKEKNGSQLKDEDLPEFKLYRKIVDRITEISIKNKYNKEDLKSRGRGLKYKSIDHIFSVFEGFINGILPQIIGSKSNIRLISFSENSIKHTRCDISLDELFKEYDKEIKENK